MGTKVKNKVSSTSLKQNLFQKLSVNYKKAVLVLLVFAIALFVRTYKLSSYPDGFDEDEMALGYYAYSILKTGADEHGNKYPIYFESVGDYKYGLYSYFAIIPVSVFGLNIYSTRITAALFGSLTIILIYLIALEIFKKDYKYGLLASIALALNPTHIHFSRIGYSNVFGSFWALLAVLCYIKIIKKINIKTFTLGIVSLVAAIYSYQAYRVLLPAALITLPFLNPADFKTNIRLKILFPVLGITIVFFSFLNPISRVRSSNSQALINTPALVENFSEDNIAGSSLFITRVIHNKVTIAGVDFVKRYLAYFDPNFLFTETTSVSTRHGIPQVGLLLLIELPLMLIGIMRLKSTFPIVLLAISPLAAAMVADSLSITRAVFMMYPFALIVGSGIYYLTTDLRLGKLWQTAAGFGLALLYICNFLYFVHQYTVHKTYHHPWNTDIGLLDMVVGVNEYITSYDKVVVSRGHYMPFLFVNHKLSDKLIFNMPYDCPSVGKKNVLYVCFGTRIPKDARVIEVYRYKDGQPALFLVDFNYPQVDPVPEKMTIASEITNIKLDEKDYWPTDSTR